MSEFQNNIPIVGTDIDGLSYKGTCTNAVASTTAITVSVLSGFGDDFFNGKYYMQVIASGYELLTIDVAPAPADWSAGATLTGATSLQTCYVVAKITSTTYIVKSRSGTFTDGEVISDGTNSRDCAAGFPTFTTGAAPENQVRAITDYVSATGTFTVSAFTVPVGAQVELLILHESIVAIGRNDSGNTIITTAITSNADGSVLERLEFIQTALGGAAIQLRTEVSKASTVEENAYMQFSISLMDVDSGAVASADIDITGIAVELAKSTGGAAFSAVGITQPTFSKADGRVYTSNQFLAAEWEVGDVYRLTVSGISCTVSGDIAYVPMSVWSNMIVEALSLDTQVAAIQTDIGDPSARTNLQTLVALLGNPDAAGKSIYGNIGDFVGQTNLQTLLAALGIPDVAGKSLYVCVVTDRLDNGTYGLSALDTQIDAIQSDVGNPSARINLQSLEAMLGNPDTAGASVYGDIGNFVGQTNLQSLLASLGIPDVAGKSLYVCLITDRLDNATYGLSALDTQIDAIQSDVGNPSARINLQSLEAMLGNPDAAGKTIYTNLGDFVGQTNLQSLLAALGIPDTAGKPLYTCLITDRLDNATYGLSALDTQIDTITAELAKVPKSDAAVTWNATALASINAEVADVVVTDNKLDKLIAADDRPGALTYPSSVVTESILAFIMSKSASPAASSFDNTTDSLEAIGDKVSAVDANTDSKLTALQTGLEGGTAAVNRAVGRTQMKVTTIDLAQAAGSYTLFTGTTQDILLTKLAIRLPNVNVSDDVTITSISIQTNDATAAIIIDSVDGAKANLTAEKQLGWAGACYIKVGKVIQLVIAGGAADASTVCDVVAECEAIVNGGYLA